jgi:putative transposase
MARQPRYLVPGHPQHVIQRGNNRQPIFKEEADYWYYYECLRDAALRQGCAVHAYVLMENHVHLLLTPQSENAIGRMMQSVGRRYVQYFNSLRDRSGTLWEGRYRATLIDSENYLLLCSRYIELNPVRTAHVKHPKDYPWSSYGWHAHGVEDPLISDHDVYLKLGKSEIERRTQYRSLFKQSINDETLSAIRDTLHKGWVLGGDKFMTDIAKVAGRRVQPLPRGRRARTAPAINKTSKVTAQRQRG